MVGVKQGTPTSSCLFGLAADLENAISCSFLRVPIECLAVWLFSVSSYPLVLMTPPFRVALHMRELRAAPLTFACRASDVGSSAAACSRWPDSSLLAAGLPAYHDVLLIGPTAYSKLFKTTTARKGNVPLE
jgi:hypothetical protein